MMGPLMSHAFETIAGVFEAVPAPVHPRQRVRDDHQGYI
jgi:hypothetical protein